MTRLRYNQPTYNPYSPMHYQSQKLPSSYAVGVFSVSYTSTLIYSQSVCGYSNRGGYVNSYSYYQRTTVSVNLMVFVVGYQNQYAADPKPVTPTYVAPVQPRYQPQQLPKVNYTHTQKAPASVPKPQPVIAKKPIQPIVVEHSKIEPIQLKPIEKTPVSLPSREGFFSSFWKRDGAVKREDRLADVRENKGLKTTNKYFNRLLDKEGQCDEKLFDRAFDAAADLNQKKGTKGGVAEAKFGVTAKFGEDTEKAYQGPQYKSSLDQDGDFDAAAFEAEFNRQVAKNSP